MVTKKKAKKEEVEEEGGLDLDDAFDDDDVEYAEAKPKKVVKKKEPKAKKVDSGDDVVVLKGSKDISKVKKGDIVTVDGLRLEVDDHYVMIDHGGTKEMAIELFDPKKDKDYQLRYFSDRVENSMEFYVLEEIVYNKTPCKKVEW